MPWSERRYPNSMNNLPYPVRRKATEIANALLKEGHDEGRAIRIAIWRAQHWGAARRLSVAGARPRGGWR